MSNLESLIEELNTASYTERIIAMETVRIVLFIISGVISIPLLVLGYFFKVSLIVR